MTTHEQIMQDTTRFVCWKLRDTFVHDGVLHEEIPIDPDIVRRFQRELDEQVLESLFRRHSTNPGMLGRIST